MRKGRRERKGGRVEICIRQTKAVEKQMIRIQKELYVNQEKRKRGEERREEGREVNGRGADKCMTRTQREINEKTR